LIKKKLLIDFFLGSVGGVVTWTYKCNLIWHQHENFRIFCSHQSCSKGQGKVWFSLFSIYHNTNMLLHYKQIINFNIKWTSNKYQPLNHSVASVAKHPRTCVKQTKYSNQQSLHHPLNTEEKTHTKTQQSETSCYI